MYALTVLMFHRQFYYRVYLHSANITFFNQIIAVFKIKTPSRRLGDVERKTRFELATFSLEG